MKLLVATRSEHKMREIREILSSLPQLEVLSPAEAGVQYDPEEEEIERYDTFEGNARAKASFFQRRSGLATVADDSGIEVDALDSAPGVRSKRFAPVPPGLEGEERDRANNAWLLESLEEVSTEGRTAHYVCVAALDRGEEEEVLIFRGTASGRILEAEEGWGGFGYDPLFLDEELERSFAEISPEEKNARSHRGRAFRSLAAYLTGGPPDPGADRDPESSD